MADTYLWSGATGSGDGSSWADAYTAESPARQALQGGFTLFKARDHVESGASRLFYSSLATESSPAEIVIVDRITGVAQPPALATISVTGNMLFNGRVKTTGDKYSAASFTLNADVEFDGCSFLNIDGTFLLNGSAGQSLTNCTLNWTGSNYNGVEIRLGSDKWSMIGCTVIITHVGSWSRSVLSNDVNTRQSCGEIVGCDFSAIAEPYPICGFNNADYIGNSFVFLNTKFSQNPAIINTQNGISGDDDLIEIFACDFGAGHAESRRYTFRGNVFTDSLVVVDGADSFDDNGTLLSQRISPGANCNSAAPVVSIEMSAIASPGQNVISVDVLEDFTSALTDGDAWIEASHFIGQGLTSIATSRVIGDGQDAALATGQAAWLQAPTGSRSVSISTQILVSHESVVSVKLCVARYELSKSAWANPKIKIAPV